MELLAGGVGAAYDGSGVKLLAAGVCAWVKAWVKGGVTVKPTHSAASGNGRTLSISAWYRTNCACRINDYGCHTRWMQQRNQSNITSSTQCRYACTYVM